MTWLRGILDLSKNEMQRRFVYSGAQFLGFYGGIRNGKTVGGAARGLLLSDVWPGNVGLICRRTYQELRDTAWKELLILVRRRNGGTLRPGPYVKRYVESPALELELQNGSIIMGRYADNPETVLGLTLGWAWFDQAEFISEEIYDHVESRVESLWTPSKIAECIAYCAEKGIKLISEPRGMMFITGNPAPGWVHRRYKLGLNSDGTPFSPNPYTLLEASTAANALNLGKDYIKKLLQRHTPEWIKRFVEGDWSTFEGQVYKGYSDALHGIDLADLPPVEPKTGNWAGGRPPLAWLRILGWDHGMKNPTACPFIAFDETRPDETYALVYNEHYQLSDQLAEHANAVKALAEGDSVPRTPDEKGIIVVMDPATAGDYSETGKNFRELYAEMGIHGLVANKQVMAGIQVCQEWLQPSQLRPFPWWHPRAGELGSPKIFFVRERTRSLRHELPLYEWEPRKPGQAINEKEKVRKYLDHALDAWRYAMMAYRRMVTEKPKPVPKTYDELVRAQMLEEMPPPPVPAGKSIWGA